MNSHRFTGRFLPRSFRFFLSVFLGVAVSVSAEAALVPVTADYFGTHVFNKGAAIDPLPGPGQTTLGTLHDITIQVRTVTLPPSGETSPGRYVSWNVPGTTSVPVAGTGYQAPVKAHLFVKNPSGGAAGGQEGGLYEHSFSKALPAGTHMYFGDVDGGSSDQEIPVISFYNCAGALINPSGFDWFRLSTVIVPTITFSPTAATVHGTNQDNDGSVVGIIIKSAGVCRITMTTNHIAGAYGVYYSLPLPQVEIKKSTTTTQVVPGSTFTYTLEVTNTGQVVANGTQVTDSVPAGITSFSWTCAGINGAICPVASGTGNINETIATFPVGGKVTYTITAVTSTAPPATVVNTAEAQPPGGGICGPVQTAAPCRSAVSVPPVPVVSVEKKAYGDLVPQSPVSYKIVVSNIGAVAAPNTVVSDTPPTGITLTGWTCEATGGAVCPNASGTGALNETVATFPSGTMLTYTVNATVNASPPETVTNTVDVTVPGGGVCTPGFAPSPCSASATLAVPVYVPVFSWQTMLGLIGMLAFFGGWRRLRRS